VDADRVQRGALLFLDPALSGDGSRSCSTCHPGGGRDGRAYREGEPVAHGSKGARDTPALFGAWQTPPYLWDGSEATLEGVVDRMLVVEMRGGALAQRDRAALADYLRSLRRFDRGRVEADGAPVEPATLSARRGFDVFRKSGCPACHAPPHFASRRIDDLGTGSGMNAPTLLGLGQSGPYGHDGRWPDLEQALLAILAARNVELTHPELQQLLAYLSLL
jgi:cytochrome c peroxidase